ncbi:uncharacterized protein LOC119725410 [Patiria miniata]|uniref:Uncharacterized protein n=1 Tax=Patiria miniata TaxID=46514 RepID=A0A913ZLU8_PATMI|nr:uncharacterized protein LOC119725410 [Patiria miniata]
MAEAAAKTVLDKISQGHLECPICCCLFKDPKILDCLHSFCLMCLEEMIKSRQRKTSQIQQKITCPVCRRDTQVPYGRLKSLSSSFFLSSLVDEVKQQQAVLREASARTATCDCGEGKEATWRCLDCSDNLCQECRKAHGRVKSTKNHQIISLGDWRKSKLPPAKHRKPITRMCKKHIDNPLCFYCDKCDTLICSMCAALDHRSKKHKYLKIADSVRFFRSEVDSTLKKFKKCEQRFNYTVNSIEHARNRLQKKLAQARSDISAQEEAEIAKIRNKAKLLTEKVDEIGQERDSEYEKALMYNRNQMNRAGEIVKAVNDLMSQADDLEILELKPKVMHNLEFQKEFKFEPANHGPSFIGVKCQDVVSDADLGEVCVSEKWQLKEEFGKRGTGDEEFKFARGVACFSNGDIAVTDTELGRLSLFTSTGRYKTSIAQGDGCRLLKAPDGVAVTHDDLLFVTDKKKVEALNDELQFVSDFMYVGSMIGNAVAVDTKRVAVADGGRMVINIYNFNGSLISSFSNDMVDKDVAISNRDRLIFTNFKKKRLLCVDFKGNEVFSVVPLLNGEPAEPTGVLCDGDGSICVAVQSRVHGDDEVQKYDSNGAFVATVAQGLYNAAGMAFNHAADIVVADGVSVKIFERVNMAEAAVKSVWTISQGHLECPICCCLYKDPKMLDCLHSFCGKCLEEMMSKQKPGAEKIICPVCRRETQVPEGGLQSLSSSFFLSSLVDEVKHQEVVLGEASIPTATCDCGEGKEATWRCLDCSDNLCQKCRKAHGRVKYTRDHQIISLGDWQESKVPPAEHSKPITRMCTTHIDHPLHFYCDTCDIFICSMCAAIDHPPAEHNVLNIDDSIGSFRSEVDNILQKFEKCRLRFKSTETSIERAQNRLQKKLAEARSDISAQAKAEIAKIKNKAKLLTEKVDEIGQERDSEYEKALMHNRDQMERADQTIRAVNDLMSQADDFELLELKPKVMHNLAFQKELKFEPANHGPSFIGVKCQDVVSDADLGEVCVSEKWQLKDEFGEEGTGDGEFQFAAGVACFRNGDIVVTDTKLDRLSLFSSTGQFKVSVAQGADCHELEAPWGVAVTQDDLLFIADQKKVKVFDNEVMYVREFTPLVDDQEMSESGLTGIAVDEQRVAAADCRRNVISVHNLDGSMISSISNNMVDFDLAISNTDRLIFTNEEEKRLLCVDFQGNAVFNVMTLLNGTPAKPTGVLCDDDGSIYVAVEYQATGDDKVQKYDSNGAFIATVAQGLYNPMQMAFTPTGDVVVADVHSVKIFERM